jgi:RNA polymerase sigma factor (sigma-70 family)
VGLPLPEPIGLGAADLDVRDALEQLTERQREAVVLHHMLDLPVTQCAELMGLGEPTVKTHLQRGRERMQSLLADDLIETKEA